MTKINPQDIERGEPDYAPEQLDARRRRESNLANKEKRFLNEDLDEPADPEVEAPVAGSQQHLKPRKVSGER